MAITEISFFNVFAFLFSALPQRYLRSSGWEWVLRPTALFIEELIDNATKLEVGKGGLPPLMPDLNDREKAGVNHPSRLVLFKLCTRDPRHCIEQFLMGTQR